MTQLWIGEAPMWFRVDKFDKRAARVADRHYSRQTIGSSQCLGPGQTLLMLSSDELAVWGVVYNMDAVGAWRWRNSLFHTESTATRASKLIEVATAETMSYWNRRYRGLPPTRLTTEVDIEATAGRRSKRNPPGHCYLCAGWTFVREIPAGHGRSAKIELAAPELRR